MSVLTKTSLLKKETILPKLDEISVKIKNAYTNESTAGGLTGKAGLAIFMFQYAHFTNNDYYAQLGQEILDHTIDNALEAPVIFTYCSGLAGLGWSLQQLQQQEFIEIDIDGLYQDVDELLSFSGFDTLSRKRKLICNKG